MKVKNLKIESSSAIKYTAFALAGSIVFTMAGCSNSTLSKSLLYNTSVITFEDGTKDIASKSEECRYNKHNNIYHFESLISGEYYSNMLCLDDKYYLSSGSSTSYKLNHYDIVNVESISNYLTKDELKKANEGSLNKDDIIEVFVRINEKYEDENVNEESKDESSKVKTKVR